jgi:hypothetical protein
MMPLWKIEKNKNNNKANNTNNKNNNDNNYSPTWETKSTLASMLQRSNSAPVVSEGLWEGQVDRSKA